MRRRPSTTVWKRRSASRPTKRCVVRRLGQRARNAGGRHLEREALAEGDERAPDLGAALVIDALGVVDRAPGGRPPGSDLHVDDVDRGQGGAEHALDVLCDRFCVPYSHMSVSSWPAVMTGPGHKKGGSENPPFQHLHLDCGHERTACTVAGDRGPGKQASARRELDDDRHRAVVDELDLHVRAEAPALDRAHALGREALADALVERLGELRIGAPRRSSGGCRARCRRRA